jgi:hypothetical protein
LSSYALVVGNGKSGTKRVLKTLNLSPYTHCRMEPNELEGSPFEDLPPPNVFTPETAEELERKWDAVVEWTRTRMGERDQVPGPPKRHHHGLSRRLQLHRILQHNRLRRAVAILYPAVGGTEWRPPRWWGSRDLLRESLAVFKLGAVCCYIPWILRSRPEAKLVYVIRHPAGFLNSYSKRFLPISDRNKVHRDNLERLEAIESATPEWRGRFGAISELTLEEAELWFWRYTNEMSLAAGRGADAFLMLDDSDMALAPVENGRKIYQHCGVPWEGEIERYLASRSAHWAEYARPWREIISTEEIHMVERVLEGSFLGELWDADHNVSLHSYEF